jgi:hypothetical protein
MNADNGNGARHPQGSAASRPRGGNKGAAFRARLRKST